MRIGNNDYISLTDLARYANKEEPKIPIQTWMRNKDVIAYLGLWKCINNKNFKGHEFTTFQNESAKRQMQVLKDSKGMKELEILQRQINEKELSLIPKK